MSEYVFIVEYDDEVIADPGAHVAMGDEADKEYVEQFANGELTSYVLMISPIIKGRIEPSNIVWAIGAVDSMHLDEVGMYLDPEHIEDEYIRELFHEGLKEVSR